MKNLSLPTRIYILGVVAIGTLITVGVFFLPAGLRLDFPFFIFLMASLLIQLGGVRVPGQESHAYSLLTAVLVAVILLFPPANSVVLCIITFIAYWYQKRYPWYQGVFNIAQYVISVAAAELIWQLFGVRYSFGQPAIQSYLAGTAAGLAFYVVNALLVTTVIALRTGRHFQQVGMLSRASFYRELVLIGMGVLAADLWTRSPFLTALLAIPISSFNKMLRLQIDNAEGLKISKVEAEERAKHLASLNELARALSSTLEVSGVYLLGTLYAQIRRIIPVDVFGIGRYNALGKQVDFEFWRTNEQVQSPFTLGADEPIIQRILGSPGPTILEQSKDADAIQALGHSGNLSRTPMVVAVPMTVGERTMGLLVIGIQSPMSAQELDLISTMASQAAVALEKAELFANLQTQMAALEQAQLQLLQSAKLATIGELAAFIAHEINNPLTSVLGYASLILGEVDAADPRRADLEVIEKEALRARAIVRDLLGYARQTDSIMGPTFINAALEAVLPLVRQRAEGQHVQISTRFEPHLPPIMGDNNQLKQIFINLLNNAIDAMPDGGAIEIQTRTVTPNGAGPQVEIAFQDSGVGIHPEQLPKIFDPFFTTKKAGQGTGLGLPISKRIVERHGGSINVSSTPGQGTRFTINLPVTTS